MDKVKVEDVEAFIKDIAYVTVGTKVTVGVATLKNGFEVIESAACVDPAQYDLEVGKEIVRPRIINKVWELLGFQLQSERAGTYVSFNASEQEIKSERK